MTEEFLARQTARISAVIFVTALATFGLGRRRLAFRVLVAFAIAHVIHFGAVAWRLHVSDAPTAGWVESLVIGSIFFASLVAVLLAWSRGHTNAASHAGLGFITLAMVKAYGERALERPIYVLPLLAILGALAGYVAEVRRARSLGVQS